MDGIRGAAVRLLPQAYDNAAKGHLGRARSVIIFGLEKTDDRQGDQRQGKNGTDGADQQGMAKRKNIDNLVETVQSVDQGLCGHPGI